MTYWRKTKRWQSTQVMLEHIEWLPHDGTIENKSNANAGLIVAFPTTWKCIDQILVRGKIPALPSMRRDETLVRTRIPLTYVNPQLALCDLRMDFADVTLTRRDADAGRIG